MAIKSSTSRVLWAQSGNQCAICKSALTQEHSESGHVPLGMEAHIVAKSDAGPRGDSAFEGDRDGVGNLLLLCPSDHMIVDKDPARYTVELLTRIKLDHEAEVQRRLSQSSATRIIGPTGGVAEIITTGTQLWDLLHGAQAAQFNSPDPADEDEAALLGDALAHWEDSWSISGEFNQSQIIDLKLDMVRQLEALQAAGFITLGRALEGRITGGNLPDAPYRTALIKVDRAIYRRLDAPIDPADLTEDERGVFSIMLDAFRETGRWPTLPVLSKRVHRQLGLDAVHVLKEIPAGLTAQETANRIYPGMQGRVGLTIAGIALCENGSEVVDMFMVALARLIQAEDEFEPEDAEEPPAQSVAIRDLAPADATDTQLRQLHHTLDCGLVFVSHQGGNDDDLAYTYEPRELLRRFHSANTIRNAMAVRRELVYGVPQTNASG